MTALHYGILTLAGGLLILVWAVAAYNRLTALRNRARGAFAQIDTQLKRRYDLIPNLVEAVKGYMTHERETLEAVTRARNQALAAETQAMQLATAPGESPAVWRQLGLAGALRTLLGAEANLSQSLTRLIGLREAYPQLKADRNMADLMEELTTTENRVAFARQAYNDAVTEYNTARERFPQSLIVSACRFEAAELFEITLPTEREAVRVKLEG